MTGPRRSSLAVPASNWRMMEKAAALPADEVFLDLEDACAPSEKVAARDLAVRALAELDFGESTTSVRINDVSTPWFQGDIEALSRTSKGRLRTIIVPKVEDATHLERVEALLGGAGDVALQAQIESPTGAVNLRQIAQASSRLVALIFGPGDYAAALGVPQHDIGMIDSRYPGHQWHWVMSEIAAHARAAGLQAIDGPYVDFNDEEGYRESARRSRLLGFDGKWCIHPNQVPWANEAYSPDAAEVAHAQEVVDAYALALSEGRGAISVQGKLVDEASRKLAEATLAKARVS